MSFFTDRIANVSQDSVRTEVVGQAQGADLKVTNWRIPGVANQILEAVIGAIYTAVNVIPTFVRGFASLDTSTDPGDEDPYDPNNVSMAPEEGFLSTYGKNTFGTTRTDATYAAGFFTLTNVGPSVRTLAPEGLICTWTGGSPPSPPPTYINAADPSVYTNPDGTVTVGVGSSVTFPIQAQVKGAIASAPAGALTLTTTLVGCSGTNADPILGSNRESAPAYRDKCRQAPARLSLGGPSAAYNFLAQKNLDGTPLLNALGAPVNITRTQVTEDSATGIVNAYYATDSGAAISVDVTAANQNIRTEAIAVPDAITFGGFAATETSIHVVGTARIKARSGVTAAAVASGVVAALVANAKTIPVGGVDQVAGAGVVYTGDLEAFARLGYLGLYDVVISTPAGLSTAIPLGHVAVINSVAGDGLGSGDWTITVVA